MPVNGHLEWNVKYRPGILSARGYKGGREIISDEVRTAGEPAGIQLSADRTTLQAEGEDVSVVTVSINDAAGRMVPAADNPVRFTLTGPGKIIGVGNGRSDKP